MRRSGLDHLIIVIHQIAKPNRRTVQQRSTRDGIHSAPNSPSLVRLRQAPTAGSPRNRRNFTVHRELVGEFSAPADRMAVGGVWGELVSAPKSLIDREFISTSRELLVDDNGFQRAAMKPAHPLPRSGDR